jgi:lycopene cyclase domain-containing protein
MTWEYLLFNIIVISGPLLSIKFFPKVKIPKLRESLIAVIIPAVFFILWDQAVTGWFWTFNPLYITSVNFFKLPIEEILFFLTVPWACLFLWVNIQNIQSHNVTKNIYLIIILIVLSAVSLFLFRINLYYTASVFLVMSLILLVEVIIKSKVYLHKRFFLFMLLVFFLTLFFNGYLTARPVVLYNDSVKTNLNIFTVPIEDFIYGLALIFWVVIIYEKLTKPKSDDTV